MVFTHTRNYFVFVILDIMKKKLNHGATKRKTVKVTEDKEPENTNNNPVKVTTLDEEDQGFGGWLT